MYLCLGVENDIMFLTNQQLGLLSIPKKNGILVTTTTYKSL